MKFFLTGSSHGLKFSFFNSFPRAMAAHSDRLPTSALSHLKEQSFNFLQTCWVDLFFFIVERWKICTRLLWMQDEGRHLTVGFWTLGGGVYCRVDVEEHFKKKINKKIESKACFMIGGEEKMKENEICGVWLGKIHCDFGVRKKIKRRARRFLTPKASSEGRN